MIFPVEEMRTHGCSGLAYWHVICLKAGKRSPGLALFLLLFLYQYALSQFILTNAFFHRPQKNMSWRQE